MALFDDASLVVTPNGYKAGTLYSIKPTSGAGDMTVVRATTATRVNSAGLIESVAINVPRLDYLNASCPSLLVEPQRTNLILHSENWSALWSLLRVTNSANSTTSPDGTLSADQLLDTAVAGTHVAIQTITKAASPITYTASIYLKPNVRTRGELRVSDQNGNGVRNTFNLSNGTIGTQVTFGTGFTAVAATITSVGNGWYRMSLMATTNSSTTLGHEIYISNDSGNTSYTGNGSGFYVWGAQLEVGSYPTSYIPTTSAAVTRNADAIYKTGISSLINSTEGVLYAEISALANDLTYKRISIGTSDNLFADNVGLRFDNTGTSVTYQFRVGNVYQAELTSTINQTDVNKFACVWKVNRFELWLNGVKVAEDTSGSVPSANTLNSVFYGKTSTTLAEPLYSNTKNLIVFPSALSDTELAQLTTL